MDSQAVMKWLVRDGEVARVRCQRQGDVGKRHDSGSMRVETMCMDLHVWCYCPPDSIHHREKQNNMVDGMTCLRDVSRLLFRLL